MTRVQLGEICERLSSGKSIKAVEVQDLGPYPVIGGNGLRGYAERYNFDGECAVIGRQGAACGNVRFHSGKAYMTEHAVVAVANESSDSHYLAYLLSTMNLGRLSAQSAQPGLSVKTLSKQEIYLPPLEKQKQVVEVLGRIDAKIEANAKLNGYLAELLEVLYGEYYLRPQGYDVHWCELGSLCEPISKKHSFKDAKLVFLNTGDVERGLFLHSNYSPVADMPGQAKKSIEKGDILYSEIRPINRHYAYVNFPADDYVVSTKLMVLRANNFDGRRLYQFLTLRKTVESLQQEAEGRSGTFPQIRFDILAKLQVPIAPAEVEEEYKSLIHVIYDLIDSNVEENGALSLLRDSLLPRLMSGEIDVSKVELPMQLNSHLA